MSRGILSLFDFSGNWSKPYRDAGYPVVRVDLKLGRDVLAIDEAWLIKHFGPRGPEGILAAPPCTDFSVSGAQYWPAKDADGRTAASLALVDKVLAIVDMCPELRWWAMENPVGRLNKLRPRLASLGPWYFQPWWYGDPYTKKTGLWGRFNRELERAPVEPVRVCSQGSWLQKLGGKNDRTKELRSMTPSGFAKAFFEANR